jgi:hypothetical protein
LKQVIVSLVAGLFEGKMGDSTEVSASEDFKFFEHIE